MTQIIKLVNPAFVYRIFKEGTSKITVLDVANNSTTYDFGTSEAREEAIAQFKEDLKTTIYDMEVYDDYEHAIKRR